MKIVAQLSMKLCGNAPDFEFEFPFPLRRHDTVSISTDTPCFDNFPEGIKKIISDWDYIQLDVKGKDNSYYCFEDNEWKQIVFFSTNDEQLMDYFDKCF